MGMASVARYLGYLGDRELTQLKSRVTFLLTAAVRPLSISEKDLQYYNDGIRNSYFFCPGSSA